MGFRDRFYTPQTARALLSGRLAIGAGVGVALGVAGLPILVAVGAGAGLYAALVVAAMPGAPKRRQLDPFTVSEPWRRFVQGAQRAARRVHETVEATPAGPLRDRLSSVVERLDRGLDDVERIARRGHEIDEATRRLDPTTLRSKLDSLERQQSESDDREGQDDELAETIASVRRQLETTDRLKAESDETARRLRLTAVRLDELVARASEVSIGAGDTEVYAHDVDDLVIELEGLRLAIEETNRP